MTTDSERREVARRLREYVDIPDDWWADTYSGFYVEKCVFGDVERHRESELFARLADLIEPGDMSQACRDTVACDRDALLKLIDGMLDAFRVGARSGEGLDAKWCRELYDDYARRIREALGVEL